MASYQANASREAAVLRRLTACVAFTLRCMARAHTCGVESTRRVCAAMARAAVFFVTGCPALARFFNCTAVRLTMVGTARTTGRVAG